MKRAIAFLLALLLALSLSTVGFADSAQVNKENQMVDLVKKFLAARRETLRWIADHRDEAVRIAAEELDLSPEDVEAQLPLYDFSMEITPADAAGLQRTADFMAAQGMMERPIDVRSLFAAPRP